MSITRRRIVTSTAAGVGIAVTGSFPSLAESRPGSSAGSGPTPKPFPPLVDDPQRILALPPDFSYRVMTRAGVSRLESGEPCPSNHDGTASFGTGRRQYLILNHECDAGDEFGVPHRAGTVYDLGATGGGGCTVVRTDGNGRNLGQSVGLSGTIANCAGGPTPWGTWWTCEDATARAGDTWEHEDTGATGVYRKDHGYVFEVFGDGHAAPFPLRALGRYDHEACAISKDRRHVFLSEDADEPNGLFFRWHGPRGFRVSADTVGRLRSKSFGTLAAMAIVMDDGSVLPDVAHLTSSQLGRPFKVRWVEVPDRDAADIDVREPFRRRTGHEGS